MSIIIEIFFGEYFYIIDDRRRLYMNRREFIFGSASLFACPTIGFGKSISEHNDELNDLIEFSRTCKIMDLKYGLVNFNPRPYQIEYFKNILESNTFVCRKCRQCGATTMNLIYSHWMAERHPEKRVFLVYNKRSMIEHARHVFNSMFYDNLMMWHQNTRSVEFTTYDSFIKSFDSITYSPYVDFKSYAYGSLIKDTIVLFDEYAFIPKNQFSILMGYSILDSMKTIWISTPNASNDLMWKNGNSSKTITRMKITGDQVFPQYRLEELRQCLGNERFDQEILVS